MSSAVDDDTRRAVAEGRATLGAVLSAAQTHLQKAFIVFVVGLVGSIYVLRAFVWDRLKADLFAKMGPSTREQTEVIAVTPFDVILLQIKIGLVVGVLLALPVVVFYSRDALRERGWWPAQRVARWKLAVIALLGAALFLGGVGYAYTLFFPLMFDFLANNALQAGFRPTYSIVKWAEFVFLLSLSFGLAAQLPLAMSSLAYAGIVRYETFRDKWKHAVIGLYAAGALFTPPDPLTQVMWATPLVALYAFSLRLTRLVVVAKRSSEALDVPATLRAGWNVLAGVAVLAFAGVYLFFTRGGLESLDAALRELPAAIRPDPLQPLSATTGLDPRLAAGLVAAGATAVALAVVSLVLLSRALEAADGATDTGAGAAAGSGDGPDPASAGSPADIDLADLDAIGVRTAPPEVFQAMSEEEALSHAQAAVDDGDAEKAEAILDRYDEVESRQAEAEAAVAPDDDAAETPPDAAGRAAGTGAGASGDASAGADSDPDGGVVTRTTAGMVDAFTEDETTEDDIGGYYYDLAFILDSLTSKAFRLVAVFMTVLAGTFIFLYRGGIGEIKATFVSRMPPALQPDVDIVTLHPVEALIFEIKFSTLLALVATLPLVLYYAWPALKERGFARGDRNVLLVWGVTLVVGIVGGSIVGFLYVAPSVISWLATDALRSNMVIAYRINNFGWLVIFTTVGIGVLVMIPLSMLLFHRGGIVPFATMRSRWREVVIAVFAVAAFASPRGVFTMFLLGIPAALAYGAGLGLLWLYIFGGRRAARGRRSRAD